MFIPINQLGSGNCFNTSQQVSEQPDSLAWKWREKNSFQQCQEFFTGLCHTAGGLSESVGSGCFTFASFPRHAAPPLASPLGIGCTPRLCWTSASAECAEPATGIECRQVDRCPWSAGGAASGASGGAGEQVLGRLPIQNLSLRDLMSLL